MYAAFYPQVGGSGGMAETIQNYPEAMREALRMQDIGSAAGYLGSTVFGLLLPLLVMAFGVTFGARAVAGDEETGYLDLLLARPVGRTRLAVERFAGLVTGAVAIAVLVFAGRHPRYCAASRTCSVRVLARLPYAQISAGSTLSCSANRATATGGAADTLSGTNPSHGKAHSATDRPNRSAGPRPRPGSTNAKSAGVSVKYRNSSSRLMSGNSRRRCNSSSANSRVATNPTSSCADQTSSAASQASTTRARSTKPASTRQLRHIRPIFGDCYRNPHIREAYAAGRGAVIALPHSGNWDLAGVWLVQRVGQPTVVAERLRPESLFRRFVRFREGLGCEIIPLTGAETPPFEQLAARLREGGWSVCSASGIYPGPGRGRHVLR